MKKAGNKYRSLFENNISAISVNKILFDKKGNAVDYILLDANPAFEKQTGLAVANILGKRITEVIPGIEKTSLIEIYGKVVLTGKSVKFEQFLEPLKRYYRITAYQVGKNHFATVFNDITEIKKTEQELKRLEEEQEIILNSLPAWIFYKDRENRFIRVNRIFAEIMGKPKEQLEGKSLFDLYPKKQAENYWKDDKEVIISGKPKKNIIESVKIKNTTLWVQTDKIPYHDQKGNVIGIIGFTIDITERRKMEDEIHLLSITDALTGLYNRRGFFTLAEQQLRIARRSNRKMFLLYADLDNMKWINDTFGHQEGDIALTNVAGIMKRSFRESDIIARIGGDEFVVLIAETADGKKEILFKRLQENLKLFNLQEKRKYKLSLSVGMVFCNPKQPSYSLDNLIIQADKLMYKEKKAKQKALKYRQTTS